jgi:hypothetical protein
MAARLDQDAKRRAKTAPSRSAQEIEVFIEFIAAWRPALWHVTLSELQASYRAAWDEAVESLGRSAGVLEELAESTGEAIARIAARGDRIDRIQKETRALLIALVASEADA